MKRSIIILMLLLTGLIVFAQESENKERRTLREEKKAQIASKIQELIDSKEITFMARSSLSNTGGYVNLLADYDLKLKGDVVEAFLPFHGRAYHVDYGADGGIKFASSVFDYEVEKIEDGHYIVRFMTETASDIYQFRMCISCNGFASVHVTSFNREPITYSGVIADLGL